MKFRYILLVCSLFLGIFSVTASSVEEAAKSYTDGDYKKAIEIYSSLIKEKGVSANLLYNLGNAYVKEGDYGQAMLCYLRSYRLNPSDKEIKNNISYLNSKVEDYNKAEAKGKKISVSPEDKPFFSDLKDYIVYSHGANTWALWSGIMFVITVGCAALYIFTSNVLLRKIGFFGGFITLGISVITLVFALVSASERGKESQGVIIAYKVNLLQAPSSGAKTVNNALTRGTVMDVIEMAPDSEGEESETNGDKKEDKTVWYKVRLNSDYTGWIQSSDFEII
ncbi:MAG: tetratricopeptide repeat protein [Muribaculaceae bacterium]|nr:tetratricopeptide repeat protein [Muribaculaceae bacterium]